MEGLHIFRAEVEKLPFVCFFVTLDADQVHIREQLGKKAEIFEEWASESHIRVLP